MEYQDILYSEQNQPVLFNGDFDVGASTPQHIKHLLLGDKGDFRFVPFAGLGLRGWLSDDTDLTDLQHEALKQLELDGIRVTKLDFVNQEIRGYYLNENV
jgi:hypothetical protein